MKTSQPTRQPAQQPPAPPATEPRKRFHLKNIGPAFWTVASLLSLGMNIILIIIVLSLGSQLFAIKQVVSNQLINGLYDNFVAMDQAHIRTSIPVKTQVPAKFDLPVKTQTIVKLTQDTFISGARVSLYGGVVTINNAPTDIILPAGSELPVNLEITVPVDQKIPVELVVDVDIPLNQTDLHAPFTGLQQVVGPYRDLMQVLPDSWAEAVCGKPVNGFCGQLFP